MGAIGTLALHIFEDAGLNFFEKVKKKENKRSQIFFQPHARVTHIFSQVACFHGAMPCHVIASQRFHDFRRESKIEKFRCFLASCIFSRRRGRCVTQPFYDFQSKNSCLKNLSSLLISILKKFLIEFQTVLNTISLVLQKFSTIFLNCSKKPSKYQGT